MSSTCSKAATGFLYFSVLARVINAHIDQRIGFRFENVMLARHFHSVPVVLERSAEIPKLAMDPSDAVHCGSRGNQSKRSPFRRAVMAIASFSGFFEPPAIRPRFPPEQTEKEK